MRTFNSLLREAGFDPQVVKLARHTPRLGRMSVYDFWRTEREIFEYYQSVQYKHRSYDVGWQVASFVVDGGQTIFVGLYDVLERREASEADIHPVLKWPKGAVDYISRLEKRPELADLLTLLKSFLDGDDLIIHRLRKRPELASYEGDLTIDWGLGTRARLQYASRQDKPILKLRQSLD